MDTLSYIGGLLDADGSFSISISLNRYTNKQGVSEPQFAFTVNFRQLEKARPVLELIQETFSAGKIYNHSNPGQKMLTWQTTKPSEAREVCNKVLPYLIIKRHECELLLEALDLWLDTPRGTGWGNPIKPEVKMRVSEISSEMNNGQQKASSRRNKEIRNLLGG
jgi:hypothetical protein